MKTMLAGFVAALVIAFVAPVVLDQFGWSAAEQYTNTSNVRLD